MTDGPTLAEDLFDVPRIQRSLVHLQANVPEEGLTAQTLGTERAGNGVVISDRGEILTIGYLITEAESIWITTHDNRVVPGCVLGYDQETGFGLVQPLQPLMLPHLELGDSATLKRRQDVLVAGFGGDEHCVHAQILAKREFAGYWEYVLDEAIFTSPAHPNWGGTALLDTAGRVCGIGSLLVQQVAESETTGANMIVPIDLLKPVLEELRTYGRPNRQARPWLGMLIQDIGEHFVVSGVYEGCPAEQAGIEVGDVVIAVDGERPATLADLWRQVWTTGPAGTPIPLILARKGDPYQTVIESVDRSTRLSQGVMH